MRTVPAHYRNLTVAGVVFCLMTEIGYLLLTKQPPRDGLGDLIGRDFANSWMAGRLALEGPIAPYFDFATYNRAVAEVFGPVPDRNWSYPPHIVLFLWPLAFLPYLPALALWCVLGYAVLAGAAAATGLRGTPLLLVLAAPAVALNILAGQNGFFTAALLIGGLSLLDRRPLLAGVLIGLLSVKPQLGFLFPLMLLLTGRLRVFAAAGATVLALVVATSLIQGAEVWAGYVSTALPVQREILYHGGGIMPPMMPTAFMNARIAGLPIQAAWALQGLVSAASVAAVVWTFARRRDPVLSLALFVTASFLVTPYVFNYDMVVFGWVVALLAGREDASPLDQGLATAVWVLPAATVLIGVACVPGSSLVLVALMARLLQRLAQTSATPASRQVVPATA